MKIEKGQIIKSLTIILHENINDPKIIEKLNEYLDTPPINKDIRDFYIERIYKGNNEILILSLCIFWKDLSFNDIFISLKGE